MGDSVGVSVSFGKYENDAALCWEKWSTFSPNNKYLEEVGKCSTPGSVAQKKAFFEAHYKKIAAIKLAAAAAEADLLLDQEKATHSTSSDDHTFQQTKEQDCTVHHGSGEDESMQVESQPPINIDVNTNHVSLSDESPPITLDINADKLEEAVLVNNESMKLVKQHFQVDLETQHPPKIRQQIPKEKAQNVARKMSQNKVEKNSIGMKKKAASLVPETPATRLSKPKPKPTSASSLNKASAPSSSKNKNHSVSESSHLSMSMSSVNSDSVTSSRRRSLFMEQMGDKDIVKRVFKTFQNRVNQLPSSPKQLPTKQKTSTSMAYQKENERSRKAAEKIRGPTWKSGSLKLDERRVKAGVALKSNERAERRKELLKNLEEKSNAREAAERSLKSKDGEPKKIRQNLNLKAKRLPGVSKSKEESMKI